MFTRFWLGIRKGTDHSEDVGVNGKIILKWMLGKQVGKVCSGCIWLRVGTGGRAVVNTVMNLRVPLKAGDD